VGSFYVENFGCRATQADGAAIERQFAQRGLNRSASAKSAKIVVLNTCTVTAAADQDARAAIRRIHRENPDCQIIVTGCYAQRAPNEIAALPGVSKVVGNSHKHVLAEVATGPPAMEGVSFFEPSAEQLESQANPSEVSGPNTFVPLSSLSATPPPATEQWEARTWNSVFVSDIFAHTELLAAPVFDAANERTRPNLKVQDGCDNRCSFCIIPSVRGHSRSLKLEEVIREVNGLVETGYREVVISGINLGRWGRDLAAVDRHSMIAGDNGASQETATKDQLAFVDLIHTILNKTSLEKVRISSVEPMDWSDQLIRLVAESPRIAKHAHVPMQSGSDRVLRLMHRKYRPWHYREKILKIRQAMPTAAIGADVMVGFPGETDADFEQTRRMVEELPFTYLHVFTYSARPGTPAAAMANQVPVQVARERNRVLRELASGKKLAFMKSFIGHCVDAITLNVSNGELTEALTDNYLKLMIDGQFPSNQWICPQITGVRDGVLEGRLPATLPQNPS
jgi:threonylcarbamoyladenosine tRNA methylthiotransferase MtaB